MSESDSSEDGQSLLERYQVLQLDSALQSRDLRIYAIKELAAIVRAFYGSRNKASQLAMFNDVMQAVRLCDHRSRCREATVGLVKAADRVLQQQKKQQLHALHKQVSLSLSRKAKRQDKACGAQQSSFINAEEDEEQWISSIDCLPPEVHHIILSHLDPVDLIAVACASTSWRDLALMDQFWEPWAVYASAKDAGKSDDHRSLHRAFREEVLARPSILLPWRSRRLALGGRPRWCNLPHRGEIGGPSSSSSGAYSRLGGPCRRRGARRHLYMKEEEVILWLTKGVFHVDKNDSESSGESSSDSEGEGKVAGARNGQGMRQLKLWAI